MGLERLDGLRVLLGLAGPCPGPPASTPWSRAAGTDTDRVDEGPLRNCLELELRDVPRANPPREPVAFAKLTIGDQGVRWRGTPWLIRLPGRGGHDAGSQPRLALHTVEIPHEKARRQTASAASTTCGRRSHRASARRPSPVSSRSAARFRSRRSLCRRRPRVSRRAR